MKKLLGILVIGLLWSVTAYSNSDVVKKIENCTDNAWSKKQKKFIQDYLRDYSYEAEIKYNQESLVIHKRWVKFLLEEKELLKKWDEYKEEWYLPQLEQLKKQKLVLDVPYLSRINDKYLETITGDLLTRDRFRKKYISNYFFDKNKTTKQIDKALSDRMRWSKEKEEKISYLKSDKGMKEFKINLDKKIKNIRNSHTEWKKRDLKIKLKENEYTELFKICEKARAESPILFDVKFE